MAQERGPPFCKRCSGKNSKITGSWHRWRKMQDHRCEPRNLAVHTPPFADVFPEFLGFVSKTAFSGNERPSRTTADFLAKLVKLFRQGIGKLRYGKISGSWHRWRKMHTSSKLPGRGGTWRKMHENRFGPFSAADVTNR